MGPLPNEGAVMWTGKGLRKSPGQILLYVQSINEPNEQMKMRRKNKLPKKIVNL